jgi:hypothetical protein
VIFLTSKRRSFSAAVSARRRRRAVRGHDCGRGAEDAAGHGGHQAAAGAQVQDAEGTVTWGKSQGKPPKIGEKYGKPGGFSWDFELFHVFFH